MLFNKTLFRKDNLDITGRIYYRNAARGVCIKGKEILMLYSRHFDHYEIPGGGYKDTETGIEAVKREVEEETGYIVTNVNELIGKTIEYDIINKEGYDIYNVVNSYYLIEIADINGKQKLEENEKIYEYLAVWIEPKTAIKHYEQMINENKIFDKEWVKREKYVLEEILRQGLLN
jgi:8-oxo-dGTP pyrophosphatase MutT (NUDIX family)